MRVKRERDRVSKRDHECKLERACDCELSEAQPKEQWVRNFETSEMQLETS